MGYILQIIPPILLLRSLTWALVWVDLRAYWASAVVSKKVGFGVFMFVKATNA